MGNRRPWRRIRKAALHVPFDLLDHVSWEDGFVMIGLTSNSVTLSHPEITVP